MDRSLPGSAIHWIFQARTLKWAAISFSRGSSQPRDRTRVSCIADRRFTAWATRGAFKEIMEVKYLAMLETQLEPNKQWPHLSYLCQSPIPSAWLDTSCALSGSPLGCHLCRESSPDAYPPDIVTYHDSSRDRHSVPSTCKSLCLPPSTATLSFVVNACTRFPPFILSLPQASLIWRCGVG